MALFHKATQIDKRRREAPPFIYLLNQPTFNKKVQRHR